MKTSLPECPSCEFYGDIVVHNVEAAIKDEGVENGRLFVRVSVASYSTQSDLDNFKGEENWTLDGYDRAIDYCERQCRERGWKFETTRLTTSAWDNWRILRRQADTCANRLGFIYHALGLKDAEVLHTRARGLSPFVIGFFSDEFHTRSQSSQFGVLLWT